MIGHDIDLKDDVSPDHREFLKVGTAVCAATALIGLRANTQEPAIDHCDAVPIWYSLDLVKDRVEEGGWTHNVMERELLSPRDVIGVKGRLKAGTCHELHCHTTDQWAYLLHGTVRVRSTKARELSADRSPVGLIVLLLDRSAPFNEFLSGYSQQEPALTAVMTCRNANVQSERYSSQDLSDAP